MGGQGRLGQLEAGGVMAFKREYKRGDRVWYYPVIGGRERYAAVVDSTPRQFGETMLMHLNIEAADVERAGRTRVFSACVEALIPRMVVQQPRVRVAP